MPHVVLLGDSIFDNGAYTQGGPDVVTQLRSLLPNGWNATLLAVDGARTDDVATQLRGLPQDASHLVLSAGGNDALAHTDLLEGPAATAEQVLGFLADAGESFERRYRRLIDALTAVGLPLTVCTIYNGNFPDREFQRLASTALSVFNDVILRLALERRLGIIELRLVCTDRTDYANPIEPSSMGGSKIAAAISNALLKSEKEPRGAATTG